MRYICTMEYYPAIKKNKTMPFAVTLMNPEIFISSKSERGQIPHDIAYRQNLKYDTNECIYETETDSQT